MRNRNMTTFSRITRIAHKYTVPIKKYEYFMRLVANDYYQYLALHAELARLKKCENKIKLLHVHNRRL